MATKKKTTKTPDSLFVISYSPLLRTNQLFIEGKEKIETIIEDIQKVDSRAKGCLWSVEKDGIPCANLVIPRADEIAPHINEWAEGNPEKRFTMHYLVTKDSYALGLMPDVEESVRRVVANYELVHGKKLGKKLKHQILFNPITFIGSSRAAFDAVKDALMGEMWVSVVDMVPGMQQMSRDELIQVCIEKRHLVGKFKAVTMDGDNSFLSQIMQPE